MGYVSEDFGDVVFRAIQHHALCSQAKKVLLEEEKSVVVANVDCKIVMGAVIMIISRRGVVTGEPFLSIIQHCRLALHSCCHQPLPVNTIVPTPIFATRMT